MYETPRFEVGQLVHWPIGSHQFHVPLRGHVIFIDDDHALVTWDAGPFVGTTDSVPLVDLEPGERASGVPEVGGVYRHYKGVDFEVMCVAVGSNPPFEGDTVIVYQGVWRHLPIHTRTLHGPDGWATPTDDGRERFVRVYAGDTPTEGG